MRSSKDQYTGYNAPGFRFRFRLRSIFRLSIFVPLSMKELPQIRRLLNGESPLSVFNTDSIHVPVGSSVNSANSSTSYFLTARISCPPRQRWIFRG